MAKSTKDKVEKKPKGKTTEKTEEEFTVKQKLVALYNLQQTDSQIDRIRIVRGELPLEVQDLEDDVAGLQTRMNNFEEETELLKKQITEKQNAIKESETLVKKYEEQQMNVRNNREYDSLSKEIEFQTLEIQLSEKRIKEFTAKLDAIKEEIDNSKTELEDRKTDLDVKKAELDDIIGCFNKIPPQHQLDIRMHKKIIVCEYCGRILVDPDIGSVVNKEN